MPILAQERDLYPDDLLDRFVGEDDRIVLPEDVEACWWAIYTMSRREKQLMRKLVSLDVPFYGPMIEKRFRSPTGRARTSFTPLFPGYVFMYGGEMARYKALTTNCVSKWMTVPDQGQLVEDLRNIQRLVATGAPLTPEARLEKGASVRVKGGAFAGFEGVVIRRQNQTRLLVGVRFTQQGVSVLLEDCEVEKI